MLLLLHFAALFGSADPSAVLDTTYQRRDPLTGRTLTCQRCPPGSHMLRHCTVDTQTVCAPCPPQHYTQHWNYLSKCLYCSMGCDPNQVVREECSSIHDRVCECAQGYYMHSDMCTRHKKCPTGYGVKDKGTPYKDTVCQKCPRGSFSSRVSAVDVCVEHTQCEALGLRTALRGTARLDSLCASCQSLEDGGGLEALRDVLPDFFRHQKMNKRKLRMFVKMCVQDGGNGTPELHRDPQGCLGTWLQTAGTEKLRDLPRMLRKSDLHHIAYKLEVKINRVTNVTKCDEFKR